MSSNLARVGANRGKSASSDQTCRVNFSFGIHLLFAVCCDLPRFASHFLDSTVSWLGLFSSFRSLFGACGVNAIECTYRTSWAGIFMPIQPKIEPVGIPLFGEHTIPS